MTNNILQSELSLPHAEMSEDNKLFFGLLGVGNEDNCRYVWERRKVAGDDSYTSKWHSLGNPKKRKGKLTTQHDIEQLISEKKEINVTVDYFLSPNQFFSWRRKTGLSKLHANFIDIDTINHKINSEQEQQAIIDEILEIISLTGIPKPNAIVKSGSGGLHLYWIYEPIDAKHYIQRAWKEFTYSISERFTQNKSWKVDLGASADLTRLLRLPGSNHNVSNRKVEAQIIKKDLYKIEELYKELDIEIKRPTHLKLASSNKSINSDSKKRKISPEKLKMYQVRGRHNIKTWWKNIYDNTRMFCKNTGIQKGGRDYAAFILFVAKYNEIEDAQKALDIIIEDNKRFIHLPYKELIKYLSTAKATKYRYRKDTLAQYLSENLNMPIDFLYESSKEARLTPLEVKKKQKESALSTAKKKRLNTVLKMREAISILSLDKLLLTAKSVSGFSGLNIRTVYRYWGQVMNDYCVIRSLSI